MTTAFDGWKARARQADILQEAIARGAQLKRVGQEWIGACVVCGGRDRFSIHPGKAIFNCRGSGGGDVVAMVEHIDGVSFLEACEALTAEPPPGREAKPLTTAEQAFRAKRRADPRMTIRSIAVRARQMKQTTGLAAITIDGAKRLRLDQRFKDHWERKEEITGQLKELALELRVPIIPAFQRTRTARRRDDAIPQLDDADFPTLETDADTVLGIWREESWLMMNKPNPKAGGEAWDEWEGKVRRAKNVAKVIALKLRSGKPFEQREFHWDGPTMTIRDLGT